MAASPGGGAVSGGGGGGRADWTTIIKPFVTYSVGSLTSSEVTTLLRAILDCKPELTAVGPQQHSVFYDTITILASHIVTVSANNDLLPRSSFSLASQAATVLCESLIIRLQYLLRAPHPILTVKITLGIIKELCTGKLVLSQEEVSGMLALLKNQDLPEKIQSTAPSTWDKEGTTSTVKEGRRSRLDPTVLLFDQITFIHHSIPPGEAMKDLIANKILQIFQSLRASQKFVELCIGLPTLKLLHTDTINLQGDALRSTYNRITSKVTFDLQTLSEELNLVYRLLSLPLFSPLITVDAYQLTRLAISALNAAFIIIQSFYGSATNPPVADADYLIGVNIVSEAIWTIKRILTILKEDIGLPQWTWLNYSFIMSKILIHGLHSYMLHVSSVGAEPKSEVKSLQPKTTQLSLVAVQGVWNELITPMASLTIELIQNFTGINSYEAPGQKPVQIIVSHFKVDTALSNAERVKLFFKMDTNILELLIQMMTLSYRKACRLKLLKYSQQQQKSSTDQSDEDGINPSPEIYENLAVLSSMTNAEVEATETNEGDDHSVSDLMTTEDEDEPDEDDDEDGVIDDVDDEPILGKWIESVLSPPESVDTSADKAKDGVRDAGTPLDGMLEMFIGDKNSPHIYMESSLTLLKFVTKNIMSEPTIQQMTTINEQILSLIAILMKDLDQEKSTTTVGAISPIFEHDLNQIYLDFSTELGKLVQNILSQNLLTSNIVTFFLEQLGIDLQGQGPWQLNLYPRSLAVMLQVLLLKQDKDTIVVQILKRFMETLADGVLNPSEDFNDIPVEHAQTLVFLFHTLSLMQKKAIMIDSSLTIIKVSKSLEGKIQKECQILCLSRLLLFFDYLIRQLYEPDLRLVNQIRYNLFDEESLALSESKASKPGVKPESAGEALPTLETARKYLPPARLFCDCAVIESSGESVKSLLPKYYNLYATEVNYQENPKLDGLAMNFLMNKNDANHKDKKDYSLVLDAVLVLLELQIPENTPSANYLEYLLTRIVFSLPPPAEFLTQVTEDYVMCRYSSVLYMMIWLPRLTRKAYSSWLRDIFSKQNVPPLVADELMSNTVLATSDTGFLGKLLQNVAKWVDDLSTGKNWARIYGIEAALGHLTNNVIGLFALDLKKDKDTFSEKAELELHLCIGRLLNGALQAVRESASGGVKSESLNHLLQLSSDFINVNSMAAVIQRCIDTDLKQVLDKLSGRESVLAAFPNLLTATYQHDLIPSESYFREVIAGHLSTGTNGPASLKHVLGSVIKLVGTGITFTKGNKAPINTSRAKILKEKLIRVLYPLQLDKTSEFISEMIASFVYPDPSYGASKKIDSPLSGTLVDFMTRKILDVVCCSELTDVIQLDKQEGFVVDCISCVTNFGKEDFWGVLFEVIACEDDGKFLRRLVGIMLTIPPPAILKQISEFLCLLFTTCSKSQLESSQKILKILTSIPNIQELPNSIFSPLLFQEEDVVESSCQFLNAILVISTQVDILDASNGCEKVHELVQKLLDGTISITRLNMNVKSDDSPLAFHHVLKVLIEMATICGGGKSDGHGKLFREMTEWFKDFVGDMDESICRAMQGDSSIIFGETTPGTENKKRDTSQANLNSILTILEYMLDVGKGLQQYNMMSNPNPAYKFLDRESTPASCAGNVTPPNEIDENFDVCESGDEQGDEDDTGGEDSDDEGLNTKLCTYTITRREFTSQHWYHCHTCGMVDGVGVCSICARVCHKGHDVTYAKLGSFFCDCGAKTDGSCISLTQRPPAAKSDPLPGHVEATPPQSDNFLPIDSSDGRSGNNRRASSPTLATAPDLPKQKEETKLSPLKNIDVHLNRELMDAFKAFSVKLPLQTIQKLRKIVAQLAAQKTPIGAYLRIREALAKLRSGEGLQFTSSENLMVATLGSQEGAFENIKMQYNGDQGTLIRQLITSQVIRRTTISAMSSTATRRHYLAVSQEKGKLTILQLSALLSGAEMSKKKLTLPRLATVTLPFTALTMAANPVRDDVLAICGLKDCQVLVVGNGGSVSTPLVVLTQLESQNHIIKPLWVTGSQMELAVLTSDGVKIYDLGKDMSAPIYHFLLPAGKVRDATFVVQKDDLRFIIIMANDGRIYSEKLDPTTSTLNGPYYITNDLNYDDNDIQAEAAQPENKGVSLYYSHSLKLLFYTYPNGKSYVGTLEDLCLPSPLTKAVLITPKSSKPSALGLAQWTEVPGHPGLIFAIGASRTARGRSRVMSNTSDQCNNYSNPYILLLTENNSSIQEVRSTGKVKPIDFIAIRHVTSPNGKIKTSLLILSDDGSLRVCDTTDMTEFWLSSRLRPNVDGSKLVSTKSNKLVGVNRRMSKHLRTPGGQIQFPVDFFEHCQALSDIEFGGSDLLQIYNTAQLKSRLNNPGMYIVSTKLTGFNLEVMNNEASMVMTGLRVLLGTQEVNRVPTSIQIFGRTITVNLTRPRWYDIPLTREESLQSDQKLIITFGPSGDPNTITIVDSVKIYGKTKESFGWPDETEEAAQTQTNLASTVSIQERAEDGLIEKIVTSSLDLCELAITIFPLDAEDIDETLSVVTEIYLENYPPFNPSCRSLMYAALANKGAYYEHRDNAVFLRSITHALTLNEKLEQDIDPELFHHVVSCVKTIAIVRPQHLANHDFSEVGFGTLDVTGIVGTLCCVFKKLVELKPKNLYVVALDRLGIQRMEQIANGLAEIIYSLMAYDTTLVTKLCPFLFKLLLSNEREISVPVRTILVKRLRPKSVRLKRRVTFPGPSPPHCITPDTVGGEGARESNGNPGASSGRVQPPQPVEVDEPMVLLEGQGMQLAPLMNPLDAYMGDVDYPPVIDLQSDAEDEAMVELAIALSLQEQAGGAALAIQGIQEGLQALEEMHQEVLDVAEAMSPPDDDDDDQEDAEVHADENEGIVPGGEGGAESDATASPPPSDDEGSTVATEGSTMRNSEMGGSESSGSSNAGAVAARPSTSANNNSSEPGPSGTSDKDNTELAVPGPGALSSGCVSNRPFRIALLKAMTSQVQECDSALSLIPLLQVVLVILSELDGSTDEEVTVVNELVRNLLKLMKIEQVSRTTEWKRTDDTEMNLVILRMLSICVSRWRGSEQKVENIWIAKCTANTIQEAGLVQFLKELLHVLRATWKGSSDEPESTTTVAIPIVQSVLKPAAVLNPPDFTPFFLKQYVKSHSSDVLEELPLLLSEMALRLPYQIKKVLPQKQLFDEEWEQLLCEMLQNRNTPFVRRQARKLLLNMAGTREKYHLLRDLYNMNYHITDFQKLIRSQSIGNLGSAVLDLDRKNKIEYKYSQLVAMVEHLNTCIDIATQRPGSLQTFCKTNQPLQFIMNMSCSTDESMTTAILTLLKIAIDGVPFDSKLESPIQKYTDEEKRQKSLAHDVLDGVDKSTFLEFIKRFLLEHPQGQTRWQAHSLMLGFFLTSDSHHQLKLIHTMWELWPFVPAAGSRAAQFIDILGYTTLNNEEFKSSDLREQVTCCIESIQQQGDFLLAHPNANLYSSLVPFVSVDGYYLESEPCEVCYNMDKPYSTQKLANIKADAKFTATNQIIKLTTTLNIIKLSIRLTEVKKVRMIKTMAVYYSPKNISIVDLKNGRSLWQMARKITLAPSQTEIKFEFVVPITAANLILEFIDFYENSQATAETLQCPRCSASVPSQPGVCSNCGENVFQCHKCRAINYDERDPFLCHSCGFCKYAKMEISILGKSIVAVDPIENEEDHKKAETAVSSFLEKADQTYKQQQQIKANLETMLQCIKERRSMAGLSSTLATLPQASTPAAVAAPSAVLPSVPVPHGSYAAVAAAANALNNNVAVLTIGNAAAAVAANNAAVNPSVQLLQTGAAPGAVGSSLVLKNVQSLAYCYAIDCKNSYEELNRLMRKVGAYRKEMLKLDPSGYPIDSMANVTHRRCYGCMASGITLSLKLLQALMTGRNQKDCVVSHFLIFLLRLSQSAGSTALKEQVKHALCFFVKDDQTATSQLTDIINTRVSQALKKGKETWSDVSFETAEEISLLSSLLQMYDSCWEIKLRCLMKIFTQSVEMLKEPGVRETGLLPCLKIIHNFIRGTLQHIGEKPTVRTSQGVHIDIQAWMNGEDSFENWRRRSPKVTQSVESGAEGKIKKRDSKKGKEMKELNTAPALQKSKEIKTHQRKLYLMKKYGRNWIEKFFKIQSTNLEFSKELNWVKKLLFYPGSIQTRTVTAALLKDLAQVPERRLKIMELLTMFMNDLPNYGESCHEFMELYRDLALPAEFAAFLNAKGALNIVCKLLDDQIEKLHQLESKTLLSDLSQGIAVWELSRLLSTLAIPSVRRTKRVSLLSTVLGGYLALRRLKLHRTRPIDEAQEILLLLLEEITTGTEEETKVFMTVCVETLKKCPKEDLTTPVFVFERLCSLIVHEESDIAEFYVTLDKDPQQEDFLQGRMLGNPYSSTENGIGPLMRDIKNKICTDCELVALLEDDNGMELLVNNRIISLDLPVKEVYKRIWLPTNGQIEPMRIVYRMRGLLGDATEEFVETFAAPSDRPEDNETTYKAANVLVQCGGLNVILGALENLMTQQFTMSRGKPFIAVILKLLGYTVKIQAGREAMVKSDLNAVQKLLPILQLCLEHDLTCIQGSSGVVHLTDLILEILDMILMNACTLSAADYEMFKNSRGSGDDIKKLLEMTDKLKGKPGTMMLHLKLVGCLTYTDKEKMNLIFDSYKDCWDFFRFDEDPNAEFALKLEQVCTLVSNIQQGPLGDTFKDFAIERQALEKCLDYIRKRAPALNTSQPGRIDSDEWKEMVSKPALKYVLRLLSGFASNHSPTQEAIGRECIYVIHQLEQVSSDEHVGSLAENALEALRSHDQIWKEVENARRSTREEKKRLAMAMRQRQLNTMGMKTNEKGQVTTAVASILDQMEELAEETGLVCVICREGYKYQPTKVLGIYTFSKRCIVEECEIKARKTYSYCTVSHFNVIHVDCHMAAIRLARSRDEWESASLQNGNTRCNGLIPLWGQQVPESAFAACLARHNAYLQEATGNRDVGFSSGAHDIKLLLLRFAEEKSFHDDTGGGGPESNLHLIPYLIHTALYVLNTTRATTKESNAVDKFLLQAPTTWKDDSTNVEGPYYHLVVSLMVHGPPKWKENRVMWLKRVLSLCGYRSKKEGLAEFVNYRPGLIFLGLIYGLYDLAFKDVGGTGDWSSILADYIRRNDEALLKSTTALLTLYQQKLINASTIEEFITIMGWNEVPELKNIHSFISGIWEA